MIINEKITSLIVTQRLMGQFLNLKHPRLTIETITSNSFNNILINETFSSEIKANLIDLIEKKEPIPIDTLLGTYFYSEKEIIIYEKAIELVSNNFRLNKQHVELIVRLHEYAHAILHLGSDSLNPLSDLKRFVIERTDFFKILPDSFHECIAQCLCFSALCLENLHEEKKTFIKMMSHQPKIYQIDTVMIEGSFDGVSEKNQIWYCILNQVRKGDLKEGDIR